jgi:hypothetical protein
MSVEERSIEEAPPRTRRCRVCSMDINAASARCPYCGTTQFRYRRIVGWRSLLLCLVLVAAAVLITRAVVDSENGSLRYFFYSNDSLSALYPVGYQTELLTSQHGTAVAGFMNPGQASDAEAIKAILHEGGTPHSRMDALNATLARTTGVARSTAGPTQIILPGGQTAWTVLYTLDHAFYEVVAFGSCGNSIGVTVTISSTSYSQLSDLATVLPQNAQPKCDGPAFSNRDRADPDVPLASR